MALIDSVSTHGIDSVWITALLGTLVPGGFSKCLLAINIATFDLIELITGRIDIGDYKFASESGVVESNVGISAILC